VDFKTDEEIIKSAKEQVKLDEAKKIGLQVNDPKKFQLSIKSLGNNVVQVVANVESLCSQDSNMTESENES
jgi:hypothetical protein